MLPQGDDRLISFSVHTQNKYDHKEEKKKKKSTIGRLCIQS